MYRSRRLIGVSALSIFFFLSTGSTTFLGEIRAIAGTLTSPSPAHSITGTEGDPADQDIPSISQQSHFGPDAIEIIPASPTGVSNCIPFGNNTDYGFTGFIYRDVPPFTLQPGLKLAFDLGAKNDVDIRRNIYFAVANKNPEPVSCGSNVTSQGIKALAWTKVVSDSQIPLNPRGNFVTGDYELMYTAEAPFSFPGGGLLVGFGGSPPGVFADFGCQQVLLTTNCHDASGHFYARFFHKPDQTLEVLDDTGWGGTGVELGGIVINTIASPPRVCVVQIMASGAVVSVFGDHPTDPDIAVLVPPENATNVPVSCQDLTSTGLAVANQEAFPVNLQITVFTHQGTPLCTRGPFTLSEHGARGVVFGSDCLPE